MKTIEPRDLDLLHIRQHVEAEHAGKGVRDEAGKLIPRPDLARAHAVWHHFPEGHKHGGEVISVRVTPALFSVHPRGDFTGRDMEVRPGK